MSCSHCGYDGPPAVCSVCRGKSKSRTCAAAYCLRCGSNLHAINWIRAVRFVSVALFVLAALCGLLAMNGCGPHFTAAEALFTPAGSGGDGGSAGADADEADAGAGGDPASAAGAHAAGASSGGASAGAPAAGAPGKPRACDRAAWTASAFAEYSDVHGGAPAAALDLSTSTRWSSGTGQLAGQWFQVDLGAAVELEGLSLATENPDDAPAALVLELDGVPTGTKQTTGAGVVTLAFEPTTARVVRLVLTASGPNWWSINDLEAVCR